MCEVPWGGAGGDGAPVAVRRRLPEREQCGERIALPAERIHVTRRDWSKCGEDREEWNDGYAAERSRCDDGDDGECEDQRYILPRGVVAEGVGERSAGGVQHRGCERCAQGARDG